MKMILGGRFLQQEVNGEMMGMPMNGIGITGYDNLKKKYVGFWIDNMGTGMYTMEGEMDKEGKACTYLNPHISSVRSPLAHCLIQLPERKQHGLGASFR